MLRAGWVQACSAPTRMPWPGCFPLVRPPAHDGHSAHGGGQGAGGLLWLYGQPGPPLTPCRPLPRRVTFAPWQMRDPGKHFQVHTGPCGHRGLGKTLIVSPLRVTEHIHGFGPLRSPAAKVLLYFADPSLPLTNVRDHGLSPPTAMHVLASPGTVRRQLPGIKQWRRGCGRRDRRGKCRR